MGESKAFLILIGLATLAFAWVLWPFFGAVFWAVVIAIVFNPLFQRLVKRMNGRSNLAALSTVGTILLIVIIPSLVIAVAIIQEASSLVVSIQSGETDLHQLFQQVFDVLPQWSKAMLARFRLADLGAVQNSAVSTVSDWIGLVAPQALFIGQSAVNLFINLGLMLYLTFFLLREGPKLVGYFKQAVPLRPALQNALFEKFTLVVRGTVKGDILVALLQGGLGGAGFWVLGIHAAILWTALMSLLSLLPVFGAALVWFPVALYFLATGSILTGVALITYGVIVIGLVDNFARPFLVGQATKMPDYVVLMSTLGGIATFGLQGFITGPVIAAMFIAVWTTFLTHRKSKAPTA